MVDKKLDILAIGVHPDDIELGCGGTLLKHIDLGYKVGILDLTQGELGTKGSGPLRLQEAKAAKEFAGIDIRENLGFADGFFKNDKAHKLEIIKVLRRYQPDIVLANAFMDRHPDHGNASKLVSEACFLSGLIKVETEDNGVKQEKWRPKKVFHYIQDYHIEPDFVVDVTPFVPAKMEAIKAFKSQFFNPESNEPESPLTMKNFFDYVLGRMTDMGRYINADFAEGFLVERPAGVESLTDLY